MMPLVTFNSLRDADAGRLLASCCSARRWADEMLAGRPYGSVEALLAHSDFVVSLLTPGELRAALDGHPRIGAQREASGFSASEQAGVSEADAVLMRGLAEGNADYEAKFGHIYLVCATGRSGPELLELLHERLANESEKEWEVVAGELAMINRIRFRKLVEA